MSQITTVFNPPLPTDPPAAFDAKAQQFARDLNPFGQELNALAQDVESQAASADQSVTDAIAWADVAHQHANAAGQQAQAASTSAAQASQAANANATTWVPGGVYTANQVVWADGTSGLQLRCILPHSGITINPVNDPTRWVRVGPNSPAPDPTAGASLLNLQRDSAGVLTGSTFTQDGQNGTETLTRDAQDRIIKRTVVWSGATRTETMLRDPTTGRLLGYALTGPNELTNSLFRPGSFPAEWSVETGSNVGTNIVADPMAPTGFVLAVGANSVNDTVYARTLARVPIDPNALLRMRIRYMRESGTGQVFIGLACRNAADTMYVNVNNQEIATMGSGHYAVSSATPPLGVWQTSEFYFKGRSAGASSGTGTLSNPRTFAALADSFSLMFVCNYDKLPGRVIFSHIVVEEVKS